MDWNSHWEFGNYERNLAKDDVRWTRPSGWARRGSSTPGRNKIG